VWALLARGANDPRRSPLALSGGFFSRPSRTRSKRITGWARQRVLERGAGLRTSACKGTWCQLVQGHASLLSNAVIHEPTAGCETCQRGGCLSWTRRGVATDLERRVAEARQGEYFSIGWCKGCLTAIWRLEPIYFAQLDEPDISYPTLLLVCGEESMARGMHFLTSLLSAQVGHLNRVKKHSHTGLENGRC